MMTPKASGCSVPTIPMAARVTMPTATCPWDRAMYGSSFLRCFQPEVGFEAAGLGGSVASTVAPGAPLICTPQCERPGGHRCCYGRSQHHWRESRTHLESYHSPLRALRFGTARGGKGDFHHSAGLALAINSHRLRHVGPDVGKIKL